MPVHLVAPCSQLSHHLKIDCTCLLSFPCCKILQEKEKKDISADKWKRIGALCWYVTGSKHHWDGGFMFVVSCNEKWLFFSRLETQAGMSWDCCHGTWQNGYSENFLFLSLMFWNHPIIGKDLTKTIGTLEANWTQTFNINSSVLNFSFFRMFIIFVNKEKSADFGWSRIFTQTRAHRPTQTYIMDIARLV